MIWRANSRGEPYLTKTVALRRAACGEHDEQVVDALKLLGALYANLGDKGRSAECYAEALDITEKSKAD